MKLPVRNRLKGIALVLPLFAFMLAFFVWPLLSVSCQAVSDASVSRLLPATALAAKGWNRQAPVPATLQRALVIDLGNASDEQAIGEMVRRLNSGKPGFRSLIARSLSAVRESGAQTELPSVDPRWDDPTYWEVILEALPPLTSRYLLSAVDMEHNAAGDIVGMAEGNSANRLIIWRTFSITAIVTLVCLVVGYPYAFLLAATTGWKKNLLLGAVLLPLWTSLLVRTTGWLVLLQENGLVNGALQWLHLTDSPLMLIFNRTGVIISMTHILLPFMVLPIYGVIVSIPKNLMPAAGSLGASPARAFLEVMLPLTFRGILSGMLLVFMSAIGYYITPALIGGPTDQMISSVIAFYAAGSANWGMASALGVVLLAMTLVLYVLYQRFSRDQKAVI